MNQQQGQYLTRQLKKKGILKPSDCCDICKADPSKARTEEWHKGTLHKRLVAHHWKGYEHFSDVWWICYRCNTLLKNCHDGQYARPEEARKAIYPVYTRN